MNSFSIVLVFIFYIVSIVLKSKKDQKKIIKGQGQPSPHTPPRRVQPERSRNPIEEGIFDQIEERVRNYKEKLKPADSVPEEEEEIKRVLEERRSGDRKVEANKGMTEKSKNPIYGQEIGRDVNLRFDQDAILKGVIMSEILSKPKSMKK